MEISIVSPIYKGEKMLEEFVSRLTTTLASITDSYEIILVNDKSPDNSWDVISQIAQSDKHVKGIDLSRNFGQHYAITAGLSKVSGEWVVVMDCDLQDQPEEIPLMYKKAKEGYDSIIAQRVNRKDSFIRKMYSTLFYKIFSFLTEMKQDKHVANFGMYNKKVIEAVLSMGDSIRYFPMMVQWVGFKKYYVPVKHSERAEGKSGYNIFKLLKIANDNIIGFSDKPLRLMLRTGIVIILISFIIAVYFFVKWMLGQIAVSGFTTLIISIWFAVGLITSMLGITGLYIGKIFDRVKGRPKFIINSSINL